MAAPGTMPPPSTRSNSPMPLGQCETLSVVTSVIGRAARSPLTAMGATPRADAVEAAVSTTVPHDWHSAHRPTHLIDVQPHSVQRNVEVTRAMPSL